ncbi:MAG: DUF4097 family beta strand repeat-containing protein [Candidatus Zixiibacteriota bacterium]
MKPILRFLLSLAINLILFTPVFADLIEDRELSLSAEGINAFEIDCGAGDLIVEGVEGLSNIEVRAEIIIEGMKDSRARDYIDKYLRLELVQKHGRAVLNSYFDRSMPTSLFSFGSQNALINLFVKMPKNMDMRIDDGSGDTRISNISGDIDIDDGSGDLEIEFIGGNVDIDDGSGELVLSSIDGTVVIDDGSGEIRINDVTGDVDIDDGSGDIAVRKIGGSVAVDDGSGDISIRHVGRDVDVIDDSSGDVSISYVEGRVRR